MNEPTRDRGATALTQVVLFLGVATFLYGGIQGRRAGWELMATPLLATWVLTAIAIARQRRRFTVIGALAGSLLAAVGFLTAA